MEDKIVIVGAGPTGLGAAWALLEKGYDNFEIYDEKDYLGGLCASFLDSEGFLWDQGGHVVFSHYPEVDQFFSQMIGNKKISHERVCEIRSHDRWIPYPFQNNIRNLPKDVLWECLEGLMKNRVSPEDTKNFKEWVEANFGSGISKHFMAPYNWKVWATPLHLMSKNWIEERVSLVSLKEVLKNMVFEKDETHWGPNHQFWFPEIGGTGALYEPMKERLGKRLKLNSSLVSADSKNKTLHFDHGLVASYDHLINTIPLDLFIQKLTPNEILLEESSKLFHNGVMIVGIGLDKPCQDPKCWMYFPEDNCPFYRVTHFSKYSPNNVPKPGLQSSFMCEIAYSSFKEEDEATIVDQTIQGLLNVGLIQENDPIISRYFNQIPYGYPIPSLDRDSALRTILPELNRRNILSRGRFGAWKYEYSNMDHSLKQGMEAANYILSGSSEKIIESL